VLAALQQVNVDGHASLVDAHVEQEHPALVRVQRRQGLVDGALGLHVLAAVGDEPLELLAAVAGQYAGLRLFLGGLLRAAEQLDELGAFDVLLLAPDGIVLQHVIL
jgi:hypothetical protein